MDEAWVAANISDERDSRFMNSESFHMAAFFAGGKVSYRLLRNIKKIERTLTPIRWKILVEEGVSKKAASMKT